MNDASVKTVSSSTRKCRHSYLACSITPRVAVRILALLLGVCNRAVGAPTVQNNYDAPFFSFAGDNATVPQAMRGKLQSQFSAMLHRQSMRTFAKQ
eukprot:scaffold651509_cov34-Prasinocladus_malaysianus.AAC.1